ncbi:MBL fold metallo-hydrolase [Pelosinus propionicus]|uniref:Glyoxylase, beta-lactamase superfamily II n=1 Tax=Pelosinus propionicus DSM 13327 TaxID=1123291 RepID=A0A1I4KTJ6_9FIRM|nr:MBL fold metallo-hydrolase [Pelosinus propionicus]SFL81737.1 Glyoxylase, beta-lactamase superfamily II [Pelosinus propionicus DSM 13327]
MKVIRLEVGNLRANCYIVYSKETLEGAVIDPGGNAQDIINVIRRENIKIVAIINTHGHADHIGDNDRIMEHTGAPILIHKDDANMLISAQGNLSMYIGNNLICKAADRLLTDGEIIQVGEMKFQVIHTPGHTPGGICIKANDVVFSGDTLFEQSVGRSDFPGGSHPQLIKSIKEKLLILPDATKILPGHGSETTIGNERYNNPFIQ